MSNFSSLSRLAFPLLLAASLPFALPAQSKQDQAGKPHAWVGGEKPIHTKKEDDVDDPNGRDLIGIVRDTQGAAVPSALVHMKNVRTGKVRSIVATHDGTYRFQGLNRNDDYEISAELKGLASPTRKLSLYDTRPNPYFSLVLSQPAAKTNEAKK